VAVCVFCAACLASSDAETGWVVGSTVSTGGLGASGCIEDNCSETTGTIGGVVSGLCDARGRDGEAINGEFFWLSGFSFCAFSVLFGPSGDGIKGRAEGEPFDAEPGEACVIFGDVLLDSPCGTVAAAGWGGGDATSH
jgi:hypothetical protein